MIFFPFVYEFSHVSLSRQNIEKRLKPESHINPHTTQNSSNRSDKGLALETSAFKLSKVANLRFKLSC